MSYQIASDVRCELGEGLLWKADEGALYWVDILAPAVHRLELASNTLRSWPMPEPIGWIIPRRAKPGFIAGFKSGFAELTLDPVIIRKIGDPSAGLPGEMRMNDAKADAKGRIFAGTMCMKHTAPGSFYRLDPDLTWHRLDTGYGVTNGPAFSPDQRTLYHTDTTRGLVYRFDVDADGGLHDKRVFIAFEPDWGAPDGMTTDAEGGLWIAHWGGSCVSRFDPDGKRECVISLPAPRITNCVFAGENLARMFVTSAGGKEGDAPIAGAVFEIDPGCRGLPPGSFAG